ncbi:MAG TPA: hypothetical protein PJ986_07125 [Gammaproteobacteria bacterium]|nr:hypothetical protein [Gammaproteobacteria bacterium]
MGEGLNAYLLVIDPATVAPLLPTVEHDLPAGAKRLVQKSRSIHYTIVGGEVGSDDRSSSPRPPRRLG